MCVLTYDARLLQLIAGKGAKGAMATQREAMESDGDSKLVVSQAESGKKRELSDDIVDKSKQLTYMGHDVSLANFVQH